MFLIKNTQLNQLAAHQVRVFIDKLILFLEDEYPEEVLLEDPAEVRQRLLLLIKKAQHYGFAREQHVTLFVLFCMELGDEFDRKIIYEPFVKILSDKMLDPQTRIDHVGELIFDELPTP